MSVPRAWRMGLSYTFVLHQTTTASRRRRGKGRCLIPLFYIKPQLRWRWRVAHHRCLIPLFYIKPQPCGWRNQRGSVVLYLCSTSNHNPFAVFVLMETLSYTFVLHQTTTLIEPHLISIVLSYTFVLHQTTTTLSCSEILRSCLIPLFYIKPQRICAPAGRATCCLIPLFYIKPQHTPCILFANRWLQLVLLVWSGDDKR